MKLVGNAKKSGGQVTARRVEMLERRLQLEARASTSWREEARSGERNARDARAHLASQEATARHSALQKDDDAHAELPNMSKMWYQLEI